MMRKVALGLLIGLYVWLLIVMDLPSLTLKYKGMFIGTVIFALTLVGLIICCAAMMSGKAWAAKPLLMLNGIYLLYGIYMVHFAWTFYIFNKPTLAERIIHLKMPLLAGIVVPLLVFQYLRDKKVAK